MVTSTDLRIIPRIKIVLPDVKTSKRGPSWQEDYLIPISRIHRGFWPPYKVEFQLRTDIGSILTNVTGASAQYGDRFAGHYITKGLRFWFRNHLDLRVGSVLEVYKLEDLLYELNIERV